MRSNRKELLLGFALIALICVAAFFALKWLGDAVLGLEDKAEATVLGGFIAFGLASFAFWRELRKSREEAHRQKKIEIYQIFFGIISNMLRVTKRGENVAGFVTSDNVKDKMYEVREGILFYGSPKVMKAYSSWLLASGSKEQQSSKESLESIGAVLLAMRADIGLSNFGLTSLNIHQIYVTDDLSKLA